MEKYGKKSSNRRTRHFDIRFFNVKDKIAENNITVEYCPTDKMVADFFTKPLQAAQFRCLRRIVMGMDPISSLSIQRSVVLSSKERVGSTMGGATSPLDNLQVDEGRHRKRATYADAVRSSCICSLRKTRILLTRRMMWIRN